MPTNKIIQPLLNPVKFIELDPTLLPQYLSRHFDDFFYMETIKPWQQHKQYLQPWQNSDSIRVQFQSQIAPMKLSVIDKFEQVYSSNNLVGLQQNTDDPSFKIYQGDLALAPFAEGLYFLKLECGNVDGNGNFPNTLISEPIHIAELQKETLYLNYKHHQFHGDVIFETGFSPYLRVRASLRLKSPSSKDTFFEEQELGMVMLRSKPFRVYELSIGGATGIPDYLADMINRILGCSTLIIDGKSYTKNDGANLEERSQANYPMRSWTVELRETNARASKVYENDSSQNGPITIIATVDGKGFGLNEAGGSAEQIQELI